MFELLSPAAFFHSLRNYVCHVNNAVSSRRDGLSVSASKEKGLYCPTCYCCFNISVNSNVTFIMLSSYRGFLVDALKYFTAGNLAASRCP